MMIAATQDAAAGLRQAQPVAWAVELLQQVAEAGVDVGSQLDVFRG